MKMFYDSLDDCVRRLQGTVVICRGVPAYINSISGLNTNPLAEVNFLPVGKGVIEKVALTTENFEIKNLPQLGYVDHNDYSYYLCRRPRRNNAKQGLDAHNLYIPNVNRPPAFSTLLTSKAFVSMMMNQYDPFEKVFNKILKSDDPLKKAFGKGWALSIDDVETVSLWNRGMKIGSANNPHKEGPVFRLPKKYSYLVEECTEHGIKVG